HSVADVSLVPVYPGLMTKVAVDVSFNVTQAQIATLLGVIAHVFLLGILMFIIVSVIEVNARSLVFRAVPVTSEIAIFVRIRRSIVFVGVDNSAKYDQRNEN